MADFKLSRIRFTWRGPWVSGYDYNIDDMIEVDGKTFVCKRVHTSATFENDLEGADVSPATPKWELQSDGAEWRGNWTVATNYSAGNIVKYGSGIYKCIEGHTSAATFSSDTDGLVADINKWVVVAVSDSDWKTTWNINTLYKRNDIVRYNGIVYKALNQHISATTVASGLEANQSDWAVLADSDAWRDSWSIGTRYRVGDLVKYGGIVYRCILGHTSADNLSLGLEQDQSKWEVLVDGVEYKGLHGTNTRYKVADVVRRGPNLMKCILAHTSTTFADDKAANKWEVYLPGTEYEGGWQSAERYQPGDVVQYGGYTYKSKTYNVATEPSQNTDDWDVTFTGYRFQQTWNQLGGDSSVPTYLTGDVVRFGGDLYIALVDNTNVQPGTDANTWELLIDGRDFRDSWEDNVEYYKGDIVTWRGTSYVCLTYHRSSASASRPDLDQDVPDNDYWKIMIQGTVTNKLAVKGDLKTFDDQDSTAVDTLRLPIGTQGQALRVTSGLPSWDTIDFANKVYYVAENGVDDATVGGSLEAPFRTIRFACNYILADEATRSGLRPRYFEQATYRMQLNQDYIAQETVAWVNAQIAVGTGIWSGFTYDADKCERDTAIIVAGMIQDLTYSGNFNSRNNAASYYNGATSLVNGQEAQTVAALEYARDLINNYILPGTAHTRLGLVYSQNNPAGSTSESGADTRVTTLFAGITDTITNGLGSLPTLTMPPARGGATIFVKTGEYAEVLPISVPEDVAIVGDELRSTTVRPAINGKDQLLDEKTYIHGIPQPQEQLIIPSDNVTKNMFLVRNGCGIRRMTLKGLTGTLSDANAYGTKRPTAGAYVSLDPGTGPDDKSVWVRNKSTYVQGVTTLGTACVGMKIDGDLHNGGNKSVVANDFTQVLSDGIGYWANGEGKSELVSVFTYYNHIGYLAENGGILRATNGNNSYGTFGSVAEGFDVTEVPVAAEVDNQSGEARFDRILTNGSEVLHYAYEHAGQNYTSATATYTGPGTGIDARWEEFRTNAISNIRLVQPGDSTQIGGAGYKFISNYARGGTQNTLLLANAEARTPAQLEGMAVYITAGSGAGQYGYIHSYDDPTNTATVYRYSTGTAGWDQLIPGRPINFVLDDSTFYEIEPRVTVGAPPWTQTATTVQAGLGLSGFGAGKFYYPLSGTNDVYVTSDGGDTWTTTSVSESNTWDARSKYGDLMMFAAGGSANLHYSNDGVGWDTSTLPATSNWTGIAQGGASNDKVMVVANGSDTAYIGTIGTGGDSTVAPASWTAVTLNASRAWQGVTFGQGLWFVFSSDGYYEYSADDGSSWTAGTLPTMGPGESYSDVAYGNNTWVLTMAASDRMFYSDDAVNWQDSDIKGDSVDEDWSVAYAGGVFVMASAQGSNAYSDQGKHWTIFGSANANQTSVAGGIYLDRPTFLTKGTSATGERIQGGKTAHLRVNIANNNISEFVIMDPGSGYTVAPSVVVTDPEEYTEPSIAVNINDGVLAQPTMYNRGTDYLTLIGTITGTGFADEYQLGNNLVIKNATKVPKAGSNINFAGQPGTLYKIVKVLSSSGTAPNFSAKLQISPVLAVATSPDHEEAVTFRERYSSCRLTGHDFLDIGTGNFQDTNYPTLYKFGRTAANETRQANEIVENNGGRVFYTSTDQDGNFRVGELFRVSQSTGGVTLNADFFDLGGLDELRLGGIQVGGTQATIKEFSTDNTMTANSDSVVPTQKAIKAYLENRITGGGATLFTNAITAGVVVVTGQEIKTTEGIINVTNQMNMNSGSPDGDMAAQGFFVHGMDDRNEFNG